MHVETPAKTATPLVLDLTDASSTFVVIPRFRADTALMRLTAHEFAAKTLRACEKAEESGNAVDLPPMGSHLPLCEAIPCPGLPVGIIPAASPRSSSLPPLYRRPDALTASRSPTKTATPHPLLLCVNPASSAPSALKSGSPAKTAIPSNSVKPLCPPRTLCERAPICRPPLDA
jgi:hypothetical protein